MANTVTVYRIETTGGQGVYSCGAVYAAAETLGIDSDDVGYGRRHPSPYQDEWPSLASSSTAPDLWDVLWDLIMARLKAPKSGIVFGFSTREQADAWFLPEHRAALVQHGVTVNRYDAPADAVLTAKHQCVFVRRRAKLVGPVDPVTLV